MDNDLPEAWRGDPPRSVTVAAGHLCCQHIGMWMRHHGDYTRIASVRHDLDLYARLCVTVGFYQRPGEEPLFCEGSDTVTLYPSAPP